MINFLAVTIICTGIAPTTPMTKVEFEIRPNKFSTIYYEHVEGPYPGTAFIQSIGRMKGSHDGNIVVFNGTTTTLTLHVAEDKIEAAHVSHYGANLEKAPVDCEVDE